MSIIHGYFKVNLSPQNYISLHLSMGRMKGGCGNAGTSAAYRELDLIALTLARQRGKVYSSTKWSISGNGKFRRRRMTGGHIMTSRAGND